MRVLRKIMALTLALTLMLSMGVTALAEVDTASWYPPDPNEEVTVTEVRPGGRVSLPEANFRNEKDGTPMPEIGWRFSREFLKVSSYSIEKGKGFVHSVALDDNNGVLALQTNQDLTLVRPRDPNMVIGSIKLTVIQDYGDGMNRILRRGDVYVLKNEVQVKVGHEVQEVDLGDSFIEYYNGTITSFTSRYDPSITSGLASMYAGDLLIEGPVKKGDKVYVESNNNDTYSLRKRFPNETLAFVNITTGALPWDNLLKIPFPKESFIYSIKDGKVIASNFKWSDELEVWVSTLPKSTASSANSYVISENALGGVLPPVEYDAAAGLAELHYSVDGGDKQELSGFESSKLNYTVQLPLGFSSVELFSKLPEDSKANITRYTVATPESPVATVKVRYYDEQGEPQGNTYSVEFVDGTKPETTPTPDDKKENTASDNTANTPETAEKVKDTVNALKDSEKKLPAGVAKTTTAGGKEISTIPVPLISGSATVGMGLFNTLGDSSPSVGLKFTVKAGISGGSMEVIVPGGFGKITEPGRISYSMDYADKAENNDTMLKAVKGDNAVSMTAKVGGNFTLPVTATVTVPTKLANGSTVNIYKYDPLTNKLISIGKAVVKDGKLTFATKMMGEMLFTTGTV